MSCFGAAHLRCRPCSAGRTRACSRPSRPACLPRERRRDARGAGCPLLGGLLARAGRRSRYRPQAQRCRSRRCRPTRAHGRWIAAAFADGGDEFALAHSGRTLDADLLGQRAQFREHHRRQGRGAIAGRDVCRGRGFRGGRAVCRVCFRAIGEDEISEFTVRVCGSSTFSLLPSAVMRSVSVTDFLSDPSLVVVDARVRGTQLMR